MGNTITKESDASSGLTTVGGSRSKPQPSSSMEENARQLSHGHPCSTASRSQHHHHHHRSSSQSKSKKRNAADYEMIIDPNETIDGGSLFPQGVYQGPQDFKVSVVRDMIIKRKLAPFYKGLDSVDSGWSDEELLEHVKGVEPKNPPKPGQPGPATPTQLIWLYRNTHECPICFLAYPRLNGTRCCGQSICTECFVQIKRNPPHPPYTSNGHTEATDVLDLLSEPAACPYCAQPDLAVVFEAPPFEWGLPCPPDSGASTNPNAGVTVDMIRPDWEEKLASARRRLARKSAAARMLHQSALLPNWDSGTPTSESSSPSMSQRQSRSLAYSQLAPGEYGRSLSASQVRALEQKMIDEAIRASLAQ